MRTPPTRRRPQQDEDGGAIASRRLVCSPAPAGREIDRETRRRILKQATSYTSAMENTTYRLVFGSYNFLDDGECLAVQRYRVGHVERPRKAGGQELGIVLGHLSQAAGVRCNLHRFRTTHAHRELHTARCVITAREAGLARVKEKRRK